MENIDWTKILKGTNIEKHNVNYKSLINDEINQEIDMQVLEDEFNDLKKINPINCAKNIKNCFHFYQIASKLIFQQTSIKKLKYLNVDIKQLDNALTKIEENPDVLYCLKDCIFQLIKVYFDFKIQLKMLHEFTDIYDPKKKREKSLLYLKIKEADLNRADLNIQKGEINFNQLKQLDKKINDKSDYDFYNAIFDLMTLSIHILFQDTHTKEQIKNIVIKGFFDNIRLIDKFIFPMLYDCIVLKKDITKNGYISNNYQKGHLLFDLLLLLLPDSGINKTENEWQSSPSNYNTFHQYKIQTVILYFGT